MHTEFSPWNWLVVAGYLAAVFAIGIAARKHQKTSKDFFLAGRNMALVPVAMSLCMTLFSAISYTAIANQSYYFGMLLIMSLVIVWVDAPVVCYIVIPFYYNLQVYSIYEYLEKRYATSMRISAAVVFFFWRMLWLATVVYAPCKVLQVVIEIATGQIVPVEVLVIFVGVLTTIYTFLGGMRAVIWTDVAQFIVMFGSVIAILAVVWSTMKQGPVEVWEIARAGGRDEWLHLKFDLQDPWCFWGIFPFYFLARLSFYSADQIIIQRVLTARSCKDAQKAFLLNCVAMSLFIPMMSYVGLNLYAFYQKHPHRIPPQYQVATVVGEKMMNIAGGDDDGPPDAWPQVHPETGEKLEDKILPTFIARELPVGIAGLVVSALFAACMSTMDSGLNSIATSLIVDFHRRLGVGKRWLSRKISKPVAALDEADELLLARPLVIIIGILATLSGCIIGHLGTIFEIARSAVDTPGIPLACVFLMGMITHRTNTVGAFIGLIGGVLSILWFTLGPKAAAAGATWIWPFTNNAGEIWAIAPIYPGVVGAIVTVVVGYGSSFVFGTTKSREELRGLALGAGSPGKQQEAAPADESGD